MELEELAARVKAGEPGAMLELWEAVRRFVEVKARDRAKYPGCCVEVCDLTQAGFPAVVETAERFERGQGYGFLHALGYGLKRAFAEATGTRSTKRDAIQYADSADEAAYRDDPDGPTVGELLPDEGAAIAFSGVEYADFLTYCRGVIGLALEKLTPAQAAVIRLYYLNGRSMDEAARLSGLLCKQAASDKIYANDPTFKDKRAFVESEFLRQNNAAFGYERFEYLYLEDIIPDNERIIKTHEKICEFFGGKSK